MDKFDPDDYGPEERLGGGEEGGEGKEGKEENVKQEQEKEEKKDPVERKLDLDLDEYPDGTDEILVVLLQTMEDTSSRSSLLKRGMIAVRTSLNKEQVRYRLKKLEEDNHVVRSTRKRDGQPVHFYRLLRSGKYAAKAIEEAVDVLGEVPEEVTKADILELTREMRQLRKKV
jgi:DNA-binding MarR family transcriptional regulator